MSWQNSFNTNLGDNSSVQGSDKPLGLLRCEGGNLFMYVKNAEASQASTVNSIAVLGATTTTIGQVLCTAAAYSTGTICSPVGVFQAALTAAYFGWIQTAGIGVVKSTSATYASGNVACLDLSGSAGSLGVKKLVAATPTAAETQDFAAICGVIQIGGAAATSVTLRFRGLM